MSTLLIDMPVCIIHSASALQGKWVITELHSHSYIGKSLTVIDGIDREEMSDDHIYDKIGSGKIGPEYEEVTPNIDPPSGLQQKPTDRQNKVQL